MVSKVERLSITIPTECASALNERAASDNMNKSAVISAALRAYLSGAYTVENVSDTTKSYSDSNTKIGYLEREIILKDEIIRRADAEIATYRGILSGQIVPALPAGTADQDKEDRQDIKDKKPGTWARFGAWLRGR